MCYVHSSLLVSEKKEVVQDINTHVVIDIKGELLNTI